ncbi:hypothetical protein [Actinoplanes sp. NPDC026619]|uniref:hypothetical protein n=1 Tax=Actinoplanes sp. NPDC026619 TaxID=3155798 RepID=UPI0033FCE505
MAEGFRVDLGALEDAATGINKTLNDLKAKRIDDLDGRAADYGHGKLADTVADFCDRWELGVEHLATDGQEIVGRLNHSVQAYLKVDQAAKGRMDGIFHQQTGADPAAD